MATVSFKSATRIYPGSDTPAVDKLNLEIEDGEFMVLVGPSGCGKSTSLRMLAGLEEVNEGSIYIGDRDVTHRPPKERDIAMVFQSYALYPHMSVADNMGFALKMQRVGRESIGSRARRPPAAARGGRRGGGGGAGGGAGRAPGGVGGGTAPGVRWGAGRRAPAGGVPEGGAA